MDGITASPSELNHTSGSTSNLQDQLNAILQPIGLATISTSAVTQSAGILDSATVVTSPTGTTTVTYDGSQTNGAAYLILLTVQQASGNERSSIVTARSGTQFAIETVTSGGFAANFNRMFIAIYDIGV